MTDPIERMAKAMWESQGLVLAWSELPVDAAARSICRALARAALAALVTPHLAEIEKLQAECGLRDMRLNLKDERIGDLESQVTALRAKLADAERERDALRGGAGRCR